MSIPDPKPLYLAAPVPLRIVLAGKALRVERPDQSPALYPLLRLSRIVVGGRGAEWGAGALEACMEFSIPVIFTNDGWILGWVVSGIRHRGRLDRGLLEGVQYRPRKDGLDGWQNSEERRALLRTLEVMAVDPSSLDLRPGRTWAQVLARCNPGREVLENNLRTLEPLLMALVAERLADAGAPQESLFTAGEHGLMARMWGILRWDLLRILLQTEDGCHCRWSSGEAVRVFEARHLELDRRVEELIGGLDQMLDYLERIGA